MKTRKTVLLLVMPTAVVLLAGTFEIFTNTTSFAEDATQKQAVAPTSGPGRAAAAPATAPVLPEGPPDPRYLTRAEVLKETPGVIDAAMAGPLKDVEEVVYSAGWGNYDTFFSPQDLCAVFWGWPYGKRYENLEQPIQNPAGPCGIYRYNLRTGKRTPILQCPDGGIYGLCVDYDAQRIVFSYQFKEPGPYPKNILYTYAHLYEIRPDGTGLRQLTDGPFKDIHPCILPNGNIIFSSTRSRRAIGCCGSETRSLFLCDADGSNIRMHNAHLELQTYPSVLADGRVVFTQWEYTGGLTGAIFTNLAVANPDGSGYAALAGPLFGDRRQLAGFNDLNGARQIPGTSEVMARFLPQEGIAHGVGWIVGYDVSRGPSDPNAMRIISPHKGPFEWACGDTRQGELSWIHPYPLSKDFMLVATLGGVHVMDSQGRHQRLFSEADGRGDIGWPQPLRARPREPVIPSQIDRTRDTGTMILTNANLSKPEWNYKAASLLILEELPRPLADGNGVSSLGRTYFVDRVIGSVPVEKDGSAYFEVPADRELFFVLQDERGRAIKKMRSWTALKPGETRSCVGCHESRTTSTPPTTAPSLLALRRPVSKPVRPSHVPDVLDFYRHVQPILDRNCVKCHDSTPTPGRPMLTGDRTSLASLAFEQLYEAKQYEAGLSFGVDVPFACGSGASPLLDKLAGGHHGVHATPEEIDIVRLWIDSGANYSGTYASTLHNFMWKWWPGQKVNRACSPARMKPLANLEVEKRRCYSCHVQDPNSSNVGVCWPHGQNAAEPWQGGRAYFTNLTNPEKSLLLLAPLSRADGGLGLCGGKPGDWKPARSGYSGLRNGTPLKPGETRPNDGIFKDRSDPDYIAMLESIKQAKDFLYNDMTRQDVPNFRPPPGWVWKMKAWGHLDKTVDPLKDPIDVYAVEQRYWESFYPKIEKVK